MSTDTTPTPPHLSGSRTRARHHGPLRLRRPPAHPDDRPPQDRPRGPGRLKTYVYDASTDRSDLVVLDADHLAREPVATIHLPRRVPAGFHGGRLADA